VCVRVYVCVGLVCDWCVCVCIDTFRIYIGVYIGVYVYA